MEAEVANQMNKILTYKVQKLIKNSSRNPLGTLRIGEITTLLPSILNIKSANIFQFEPLQWTINNNNIHCNLGYKLIFPSQFSKLSFIKIINNNVQPMTIDHLLNANNGIEHKKWENVIIDNDKIGIGCKCKINNHWISLAIIPFTTCDNFGLCIDNKTRKRKLEVSVEPIRTPNVNPIKKRKLNNTVAMTSLQ
eukprot:257006_1